MSKSRNIADLLDANGDVQLAHLDNVPPADVVNDTTPQLGGNLDTQTFTVDGRDVGTDGTKLDGIEVGATGDQTGAEIKTAYELEANTNAYTDTEKTKLAGIADGATNVTNNNQLTNGAGYITDATPPTTFSAIGTYTAGAESASNQTERAGGSHTVSGGSIVVQRKFNYGSANQKSPFIFQQPDDSTSPLTFGSGCSGTWRNMAKYQNHYWSRYHYNPTLWVRIS